jgi:hypothetical protein
MGRKKRHRGGQPGNQNARKHGFYAANLSKEDLAELWRRCNEQGTEPLVALLQTKLLFVLRHDPQNKRLLRELARQMNKMLYAKFGSEGENGSDVRFTTHEFIKAIRNKQLILPEPIKPGSFKLPPPYTGEKTRGGFTKRGMKRACPVYIEHVSR